MWALEAMCGVAGRLARQAVRCACYSSCSRYTSSSCTLTNMVWLEVLGPRTVVGYLPQSGHKQLPVVLAVACCDSFLSCFFSSQRQAEGVASTQYWAASNWVSLGSVGGMLKRSSTAGAANFCEPASLAARAAARCLASSQVGAGSQFMSIRPPRQAFAGHGHGVV